MPLVSVAARSRSRCLVAASAFGGLAALACACAPKLASSGSLLIDGAPFSPATCHVFADRTAIELRDAEGARLELTLPPARLDFERQLSGTPDVLYTSKSGARASLGSCGSLTLTGEGYHGSGRRAASGVITLACAGEPKASGELKFQGCF